MAAVAISRYVYFREHHKKTGNKMSKIQSIKTSDGYVFFSNGNGWCDSIKPDGTPYQIDMWMDNELINEWIDEGFAKLFEWELFWTPVYEGPFDSEQEAIDYRDTEVNRVMPTRIRSMKTKTGDNMWLIDCRREVTA